jgi:hypothetical protein
MDAMVGRANRRTARWAVGALAFASLIAAGCGDTATIGSIPYTPATPGTLRVATALPAPGFWDGGDTPESITGGYEYQLATLLADRFDLELELVAVPFDQIASGDLAGADLAIAQISRTKSRALLVDFSEGCPRTHLGGGRRIDRAGIPRRDRAARQRARRGGRRGGRRGRHRSR